MKQKIISLDIEIALADYFDSNVNLCIPNVFGCIELLCEVDLWVFMKTGHSYEIEIKTSKADLKAEMTKLKYKNPFNLEKSNYEKMREYKGGRYFRKSYFAVPYHLFDFAIENIPTNCGLFTVCLNEFGYPSAKLMVSPALKIVDKIDSSQITKLFSLGCMRINNLKIKQLKLIQKLDKTK